MTLINYILKHYNGISYLLIQPGIERVQALTDNSHLAPCCHSNETCAPIANLPNSAQLEGIPYHSPNLYPGPCSSVVTVSKCFPSVGFGRFCRKNLDFRFSIGFHDKRVVNFFMTRVI